MIAMSAIAFHRSFTVPRSSANSWRADTCGVVKNVTMTASRIAVPVAPRIANAHVVSTRLPDAVVMAPVRPGIATLIVVPPRAPVEKRGLHGRNRPQQDEQREDVERAPGDDDLLERVPLARRDGRPALAEDVLRLPDRADGEDRDHGREAGAEVGELRAHEPQHAGLHAAEDDRDDEGCGQRLAEAAPAVDDHDEQERDEERQRLQMSTSERESSSTSMPVTCAPTSTGTPIAP